MSTGTDARRAALETMIRCRRGGAWSGAAMDGSVRKYGLDRRDAAFASRLCLSALENAELCDFYIAAFCQTKLEPAVRDVLRLGQRDEPIDRAVKAFGDHVLLESQDGLAAFHLGQALHAVEPILVLFDAGADSLGIGLLRLLLVSLADRCASGFRLGEDLGGLGVGVGLDMCDDFFRALHSFSYRPIRG